MTAAVVTGVLTLVGTLVVAAIGFWQWRVGQRREDRESFRAKRLESMAALWEALVDIEEQQRQSLADDDLADRHRSANVRVNLLLLRAAPFLLDDEQTWAIEVLTAITEIDTLARAIRASGDRGGGWWLDSTAPQPREATGTAQAAERLRVARQKLGDRYAAVLRGEHR